MSTETGLLANTGIGQLMAILADHLKLMKNKDATVEQIISTAITASSLFAAKKKALENEKKLLLSIMEDIDEMNTFLKNIILIENLFNSEYQPFKKKQEEARRKYAPNISKYENKEKCESEAGSFVELIFAGNTHLSSFGAWLDKVIKQCGIQDVKIKSFSGAKAKKMERAFYKAFYVYSEHDGFKKMTDILRCSFVFESFDDLYKCFSIIEMLAEQTLGGILRVKDKYNPSTIPFGYRDLLINIYCPESKIVAEIQLHFIQFYKYKKISHHMYKRARLFERDSENLAYSYSTKFLQAKIGTFKVYEVSKDEMVDEVDGENKQDDISEKQLQVMDAKQLLKQWGLQKYASKMKEEGWEDPIDWEELTDNDLKEDLGFSKGHIKKFKRKYQEWLKQVASAEKEESKQQHAQSKPVPVQSKFVESKQQQSEPVESKTEELQQQHITVITPHSIGSMNYAQCVQKCKTIGGHLATKKQVLNYLPGAIGGDVWTPVSGESNSGNDWLQIGGGHWPYGQLHTEIANGKHGKPGWGTNIERAGYKQKFYCAVVQLTEHNIGSMNYAQCVKKCRELGGQLATKQQVLDYLPGAIGGDVWTPVSGESNSGNDWLQIGGNRWPYGQLHTEIANGIHGKPGWGTNIQRTGYKQKFYCAVSGAVVRLTEQQIGSMNYAQCVKKCQSMGGQLATKKQVLDHLPGAIGGDVWTPVSGESDSGNDWLQIGGNRWPYGQLHTEIANGIHGKPGWGANIQNTSYKQKFYCAL